MKPKTMAIIRIALWSAIIFVLLLAICSCQTNLYKNMVNASVMLHNDYGHGSGVFIDNNTILTAAHVLEQPNLVMELNNGIMLKVEDIYIDDEKDIGFIFIEVDELHISKIALSHGNIGDTVYLVGSPYTKDFKFTITKGILSHLDRDIFHWKDLLQIDAEGAPGSSGGPSYNSKGKIIGICVTGPNAGGGVILCESAKSILEAYERCMNIRSK